MSAINSLSNDLMAATLEANQKVGAALPIADQGDFEGASRGLIAQLPEGGIKTDSGATAWDIADWDFLDGAAPATVNPSLWRMAQLNRNSGLFEVTEGVWQARGIDYANMTIIRGDTGWILVDPLMAAESAEAALRLVNKTLGERPVSAILITHTHPDHFAGIKGVVNDLDNPPPIYVPDGFMEYAASEGILGGNHTSRRAIYQFGITLSASPEGIVDGGIGKTVAKGTRTFIKPSESISATGEERLIDGVRVIFQIASGTEAPSEFTFLLPDHRVMCMAEVCNQTMHNVLTPRGAQVRDSLLWARTIDEAITLFGEHSDILVNSHNWPVWGKENVIKYLEEQRDIYKYIHDQTLRLANQGHSSNEIAELIEEPEWLSEKFHSRGYYGTLKFNVRAVYQMYYGFFDGNPTNYDPLPPNELGGHIIKSIGGVNAAIKIAKEAIENDNLQWAATLLSHIIFSQEDINEAKALLAEVYRHQGFRAESGIQRNIYLTGAKELTEGVKPLQKAGGRNQDLAATLIAKDWFDAYAIRLNPEKAKGKSWLLNFDIDGQKVCVSLARQTEFTRPEYSSPSPDVSVTIKQSDLESLANGQISIEELSQQGTTFSGDLEILAEWLAIHDTFNLWFNVVTP